MSKIRTIIIDDEYKSRFILDDFLKKYCPRIDVIAQAASIAEAVEKIRELRPHLVFLDINMPGENGFQLFSKFSTVDFYTVFVTAYDEYALQAFKYHAMDYLLKPININELIVTVERISKFRHNEKYANEISQLLETLKRPKEITKIAIPVMEGLMYIDTVEMVRCEAKGSYTHIFFRNGNKTVVSKNLGVYDELLQQHGFVRVHHHHLINLQHVEKYLNGRGGIVVMSDLAEIQVSQRKRDHFLTLMNARM